MKKKSIRNSQRKVVNKLTKNDVAFIEHVKINCKELGVKVDLRPTRYVKIDSNIKCSGYFDSDNKHLVVAMNHPNWLGILVHEYCHVTQWVDDIDLWHKASSTKVDDWLGGKRIRSIDTHIGYSRDLELDNEKRAVRMIRKWKLSIDIDEYVKAANAYIHFYNWMGLTRKWSKPKNSPYLNERILSTMSPRFNMQYNHMSDNVYNAFVEADI
jgi:hypothetical protein